MRLLSGDFCGINVATRQTGGLHLVESIYPPNQTLPWHTHQWPYFTFVLRGGYSESCQGKTWEIAEGDVVLHGAGEAHADRMHDAESCLLNLEFTQRWLDRIDGFGARLDSRFMASGGPFLQLGKRLHRELWSPDRISTLCIEALALELVAAGVPRNPRAPRNPRWLQRAAEYLRANFREPPTLEQLAAAVGVHPVHLAREFHRKEGVTVGGYIRKLRVDLACQRLVSSTEPIVDIALSAGFSDHSHLTRVFRRETGVTPTQFRNLRRRA
jgi:AraC family transcriptional regulator